MTDPSRFWRGVLFALPPSLLFWALAVVLVVNVTRAHAEGAYTAEDTYAAIDQASSESGVSQAWLTRVVGCETGWTFHPGAVGDHGSSFGAAQLHRGGSELTRFYAAGFDDPFDPYQSVSFMAAEFALGRSSAWSCQ